jgi:hypothetical protein
VCRHALQCATAHDTACHTHTHAQRVCQAAWRRCIVMLRHGEVPRWAAVGTLGCLNNFSCMRILIYSYICVCIFVRTYVQHTHTHIHMMCSAYILIYKGTYIQVDERTMTQRLVVQSHAGADVWGLATHPRQSVFLTGGDDKTIRVFKVSSRKPVMVREVEDAVRCPPVYLSIYLSVCPFVCLFFRDCPTVCSFIAKCIGP